jgi:hypothetical protein
VQTPAGNISGQLTSITIDAGGNIIDGNATVVGVVDGSNISIELRPVSGTIEKAGRRPAGHVSLGLDCPASEFYANGVYNCEGEGKKRSNEEPFDYLAGLIAKYRALSIEDGMAENDFDGWKLLTDRLELARRPLSGQTENRYECDQCHRALSPLRNVGFR